MALSHQAFNVRALAANCTRLVCIALMGAQLTVAQAQQPTLQLPDFTQLVERVGPSVVNIRIMERVSKNVRPEVDPQIEELFRRFGLPMPMIPGAPTPNKPNTPRNAKPAPSDEEPQQRGVGSGFIFGTDGYVMTNTHVVKGADEVLVTLTDKREFKAKIIGLDSRTDVAVVKIDTTGLPAVKIGDTSRLKVGEWVMAIGSPFGLDNTVTAGIVSAKQRDTGEFLPFIQTDVAINPGNSGGPLLNLRGEVVGINSQIYSRSGGFMGISFAIPIDEAMRVADQLRSNGKVTRGRVGIQIDNVSKELAQSIGLSKPAGALVRSVEAASPAEKAGIEAGDIVLKVDGKVVDKASDLSRMIGNIKPGAKAVLQVHRRGMLKDITSQIGEFESEDAPKSAKADDKKGSDGKSTLLGMGVTELTDTQKKEFKLKGGVIIDSIDGPASQAGLREGDIILSIENTEIADIKQFSTIVSKLDTNKPVRVLARRGDWVNYHIIRQKP